MASEYTAERTPTEMAGLSRIVMESPIGSIELIADNSALVAVLWDRDVELAAGSAHNPVEKRFDGVEVRDVSPGEHRLLDTAVAQLAEYFEGDRTEFDLPVAPAGTEFQRSAWRALQRIPFGRTVSYGEQAAAMGDKNKARAVGAANGQNPIPIVIPCHRVVGSDGSLTGFAGGVGVKEWLLDHERGQLKLGF